MHEFELIKNYFQKISKKTSSSLNLNDDVFFDKKNNLVVSIDTYTEGNHFINFRKPDLVIKKIVRSSISDLICKGVCPKYYFFSASGNKKNFSKPNLSKISKSLKEEQNKYKMHLSGGDTVYSKKLSFTITSIGFSKEIIYRNKSKINDDIYVTGNIGDSFLGLLVLKKKIKLKKSLSDYFINQYYKPEIKYSLANKLKKFAHSSIDISDGLLTDLDKLINSQKLSYKIFLEKIPISKNLFNVLKIKKLLKKNYISNGDDYQILFTAPESKRFFIQSISKLMKQRITRIGKILKNNKKLPLVVHNNAPILIKKKGYFHKF